MIREEITWLVKSRDCQDSREVGGFFDGDNLANTKGIPCYHNIFSSTLQSVTFFDTTKIFGPRALMYLNVDVSYIS